MLLQISFPLWFRVMYGIGAPIVLVLVCVSLLKLSQQGFTGALLLKGGFLLCIVAVGIYVVPLFFSSVCANESGIELRVFTHIKRRFTWNEIETVVRPRFGVPYDVIYVVSKNGMRIPMAYSMKGCGEILRLIQSKSPNLSATQLTGNLQPVAGSWRQLLVLLIALITYIVYRLLLG